MKRSTAILLLLLLVAFALRVWNLSAPSVWWDEAYTVQTARYDWSTFWQLQSVARHPPLYFLTVKAWGGLVGWSEFSLRFLSVAYGLIGVALLYRLGRRLYDRKVGLLALGLAAVSPALIVYAQEGRMYALVFMLAAGTLYFGARLFEFEAPRVQAPLANIPLWCCEALLLLTHYFALPFIAALNLLALLNLFYRRARPAAYGRWLAGQLLVALPVVMWVIVLGVAQGGLAVANEPRPDPLSFAYQTITLWATGIRDLQGRWWPLFTVLLSLGVLIGVGAWLYNRRRTLALLAFSGLAVACAFLFASILTSFHPRYVLLFSLPVYLLTGAALANITVRNVSSRPRRIGQRLLAGLTTVGIVLCMLAGWSIAADPQYAKDDARGVAAYLKQNATVGDVILAEAYDYTLAYYDHGPAPLKMIMSTTESEALQELTDAIGTARHVWFAHWPIATQDPRGYWPFLLEQSGRLKNQTSFQGYQLSEYELQAPLHEAKLKATTVEGMVTQRSDLSQQDVDGALTFALTWQPPVKFYDPARTSVRLINEQGDTLSARDESLLDQAGRTTENWLALEPTTNYYVLPIPPGTPPGSYTVTAQLYNARNVLANDTVGAIELPRRLDTSDPYRTLAGYKWQVPTNTEVVSGLMLETYAVNPQQPGKPMPIDVTLRWRKTGATSGAAPRLRLRQGARVWNEIQSNLLERTYPIGQWAEGETVIDRLKIDYPPLRGPVELQIGQGDQWTTLTPLQLDESQLMFDPPSMQHTQSAHWSDFAELVGYDLKSEALSATRPLELKLYWRATQTEPITTPYTIFTQLLAPDGHLVAQDDAPPNPPTVQWVPGQIVPDSHSIKVVDPAYRGPATLIVGWYNSASVKRVPVQSGGDYATLLTPVRVEDQ